MWSESQLKKNKNTELFIGNTATALYFSLWAAWIFPEFKPVLFTSYKWLPIFRINFECYKKALVIFFVMLGN